MVIYLELGADLHMAQLKPLPLTVSCFSKIQIGFTFLVQAHLDSPGKGPLNGCVLTYLLSQRRSAKSFPRYVSVETDRQTDTLISVVCSPIGDGAI